jgi:hypothetical protein
MAPPDTQVQEKKKIEPQIAQKRTLIEWLKSTNINPLKWNQLLIGGVILTVISIALNQTEITLPDSPLDPNQFCQEIVQPKSVITREQLAKLLTIPERQQRAKVQAIAKQPYCKMSNLSIRAGATTEREAYPLASDPQTWLVVAYEGGTYVGYGFKRD